MPLRHIWLSAFLALPPFALSAAPDATPLSGPGPLPPHARLVLDEDWSSGIIDRDVWYTPRKHWGQGNHGVVPENVFIQTDTIENQTRNVLVCRAHGDLYEGPVVGLGGETTRVGGILVSRAFFASGRYSITMKIGSTHPHPGGPISPARPAGAVPAIWTYGYRYVKADAKPIKDFSPATPLFNPHMPAYGIGANEYWSEIDFPEYGKNGDFTTTMYNTFCQNRHDSQVFDVRGAADGRYHTYVTEWRAHLKSMPDVRDDQVASSEGFWWIQDKAIPFEQYLGNPLKRMGPDTYAVHMGQVATHWI